MAKRVLAGIAGLFLVVGIVSTVPALRDYVTGWLPSSFATQPATPKAKRARGLRPVPVKAVAAASRDVPVHLEGVGTVKARSTVAVKSRIEGQLFEALVREGQTVRTGDILFRLDPRPHRARLKEAQAILARTLASHAKAVSDVKRLTNLSAKGYSPKTQVEDARTQVSTLAATVRAAEAAVELARLSVDYATIRSPIDGRVGSLLITPGNIVKPNDSQPLLIITETRPVYVSFGVPEKHIDELRARMAASRLAVEVSTQASRTTAAVGTLFFINNQVDPTTGTIELLARFANEDERLVPGQFVRARIRLSVLANAVLVPSRAIQINRTGQYLWVVRPDDTVELRDVATGPDDGGDTSVVRGLAAGETVVTDGQLRLFPGARVQRTEANATARAEGDKRKRGRRKARQADAP